MSDNWIVGMLQYTLSVWNDKLNEIWQLKDGNIWNVIVNINGAIQAIGLALLVIFFLVGVIKTCRKFCRSKKARTSL